MENLKSCRNCIHWNPCVQRELAERFLCPCASGGYKPNTDREIIRKEMLQITAKFCGNHLGEENVPNWDHRLKKIVKGCENE